LWGGLEIIAYLGMFCYVYCTDFLIALTRITGLSYYDVNALIFVVIWPALTVILPVILLRRAMVLRKLRKRIS
jgi:hypothetical protein